jgi:hypothetical protein
MVETALGSRKMNNKSGFGLGCGAIITIILILSLSGYLTDNNNNKVNIELSKSNEENILKVIDKDPTAQLSNLEGQEREYNKKAFQYLYNMHKKALEISSLAHRINNKEADIDINDIRKVLESTRNAHIIAYKELQGTAVPIKYKSYDK